MSQLQDFIGSVPGVEPLEGIGADQQADGFYCADLVAQGAQGFNRTACSMRRRWSAVLCS